MGGTNPSSCFAARADRGLATGFVDQEDSGRKGSAKRTRKGSGFAIQKELVHGRHARLNQIQGLGL
jgi:hypothetical protein